MKEKRWIIRAAIVVVFAIAVIDIAINWINNKTENRKAEILESSPEPKAIKVTKDSPIKDGEALESAEEKENYSSWSKYKERELEYADEETFQRLKEIYEGIHFSGEFKKGDKEVYDYYREKYAKLLKDDAGITTDDKKSLSLKEYGYDRSGLIWGDICYFDMDEDGLPELCLTGYGTYIIKYIPETDQYSIWWSNDKNSSRLTGSRKIRESNLAGNIVYESFYQLNKNSKLEFKVMFWIDTDVNSGEDIYMVSLPDYEDESKEPEIQKELKREIQAAGGEDYNFRVTEKQYEELTKEYIDTNDLTEQESVRVSYFLPELERVYSTYYEFPKDMAYADERAFRMVEKIYQNIEFYGEFEKGDEELYAEYKNKYAELLKGKGVIVIEEGYDYGNDLEDYIDNEESLNATSTRLYYFDMDEDSKPELCIEGEFGLYIFKYNSDRDEFTIWLENWSDYSVSGSGKLRYSDEFLDKPFYEFLELNEKGDAEFTVEFGVIESVDSNLYLVSLPIYMDEIKHEPVPESIKNQSLIAAGGMDDQYFLRVTKTQYEKLTKEYFEADELSLKFAVPLSYFYEEG